MSGLLSIGESALFAAERSLNNTGHNIANAGNPDFSRQRTELQARTPLNLGGQLLGRGVDIGLTSRMYDSFLVNQLRNNTAIHSQMETLYYQASQLDQLVADQNTGLSLPLEEYFNAVSELSNEPSSIPARQVLLTKANILLDRFHQLDSEFVRLSSEVDQQLNQLAGEVNALAKGIVDINTVIVQFSGEGNDPPNDMLDQRDQLLRQLSELIDTKIVDAGGGAVNVLIGHGFPLVIGSTTNKVTAVENPTAPDQLQLSLSIGNGTQPLTGSGLGGTIGGLIDFRDNILISSRNALGLAAVGLADSFNDQHKLGMDIQGTLGTDFFSDLTNVIGVTSLTNQGTSNVNISITDISALKNTDYRVDFDGNYTLTRLSDNKVIGSYAPGTSIVASEGFSLTTNGSAISGDSFYIRPTREAARNISLLINDPKLVAVSSPIRTTTGDNNQGTGLITQGTVNSVSGTEFSNLPGALSPPLLIQFTSATTYDVYDNTVPTAPALLTGGVAYTPGQMNNIIAQSGLGYGYEVSISAAPSTGDTFTVDYNSGGVGDNRNALLLHALNNKKLFGDNTSTYQDIYGQLVSNVGNQTREAEINERASLGLLRQAEERQQAVSGVNLDEEAANLIKFQQHYQAAARYMSIVSRLFEAIVEI